MLAQPDLSATSVARAFDYRWHPYRPEMRADGEDRHVASIRARVAAGFAAMAVVPLAVAGVTGIRYTLRAAAARRRGESLEPDVPTPEPTAGLAGAVALDTLLTLPMGLLSSTGSAEHYARSTAEVDAAVRFYDDQGWLDDPASRFVTPDEVPGGEIEPGTGRRLETLRFRSDWEPVNGEPGSERWDSFADNATVPVRMMRHAGEPRPWLIAIHGQSMGRPGDHRMLRVRRLHEELGVNVALPVLPLHGERAAGFAPDHLFVSGVYPVNNVLGMAQSVWDVRRLMLWLRAVQGAPAVGVLGLSLGSYVASLLATVEPDLACVVALVPEPDLAGALRAAEPLVPSKRRLHRALYDARATLLHRPVSPLAHRPVVAKERLFIVAGQVDRVASPSGAAALWRPWDEPSILWRPRGHLTTGRSSTYDQHLSAALAASGISVER